MSHAFIIYSTSRLDKGQVQEEVQRQFGPDPILTTTISRAPEEIGDTYVAQGPHDIYLSIKPSRGLTQAEEEKLINAVRATGRVVGGTFSPVKGGQASKEDHKHFLRFWKNK